MSLNTLSRLLAAALLGVPLGAAAVEKPIQDNSFLLEEAYNQERSVVQTIQTFTRLRGAGDWVFTLTQEWPVPDERHQLSVTLPVQHASGTASSGFGDVLLNYRYQLAGNGESRLAVAPRLSAILPTGSTLEGRGSGSWGAQVSLPASVVWGTRLVTHSNLGATWLPSAQRTDGSSGASGAWSVGQSIVWLAHPTLNVLLEAVYTRTKASGLPGQDDVVVVPGVRAAVNLGSLQIVPGAAVQLGVGPSAGKRSVFFYLSFEHPVWTARSRD